MPYEPSQQNQEYPYPSSYVPPPYVPPNQPSNPPPPYPVSYSPPPPYAPSAQQPIYYYNPQMAPMPVSTSGWAIASLICSLIGLHLLGIIFGFVALNEIKNSAGRIEGEGLAKAGIIIGFVVLGLVILLITFWIVVVVGGLLITGPASSPGSFLGLVS